MKPILSILFLSLTLNVTAQRIRFTDKTNIWNTLSNNVDGYVGSTYYAYKATDTFIHGNWYQILEPVGPWVHDLAWGTCAGIATLSGLYGVFVREDTLAQKVYYFSVDDSAEHTLYDYTMSVGDSISLSTPSGIHTDTVASIDSVLYAGHYYKIFNMERNYTVLEGVGCTNSPVLPTKFGGCFEGGESLICFFENSMRPALHAPIGCYAYESSCFIDVASFDNTGSCGEALSVTSSKIPGAAITISPNPAFDHINIALNEHHTNSTISVYDMTDRCIFRSSAEQQTALTINTSSWTEGLYMVIIQDNSGILKKEKIVVQH